MKSILFTLITLTSGIYIMMSRPALAHCEIPCGIFDDDLRFEMLQEDISTIHKSIDSINLLSKEKSDAQNTNQIVRWINLKDQQATAIQDLVSQYFLAQRISPLMNKNEYMDALKTAHALIISAMKAKQTTDSGAVDDLKKTLQEFQSAYKKAAKTKKK